MPICGAPMGYRREYRIDGIPGYPHLPYSTLSVNIVAAQLLAQLVAMWLIDYYSSLVYFQIPYSH